MFCKVCSVLYLLSGILIALGGLGHSLAAVAPVRAALDTSNLDPQVAKLVLVVWHFAGAAMLALGAMVVVGWNKSRSGQKLDLVAPGILSAFYVIYGAGALTWMREPFWAIFVVYGILCGASALVLREP